MIGGFLGAGKTTAVARLADWLQSRGLNVGLITNDQGAGLVDTALLRARGFATEEIPGGCFCCRFNSLVDAAQKLTAAARPDVFVAEPVGSCTDLAATVAFPLRQLYGGRFSVAPISVLVDPIRALRVLGVESGANFSDKVRYIYLKQIEEADLVVVNKCDLLDVARLDALRRAIATRFPGKETIAVSARTGAQLGPWFEHLVRSEQPPRAAMPVDYEIYADGEARLGWLNCTVRVTAAVAFDADAFLRQLAAEIQASLRAQSAEVAHLKMTFVPDTGLPGDIAVVNLVCNDFVPELAFRLEAPARGGQLLINLRAEAAPELLEAIVRKSLSAVMEGQGTIQATVEHLDRFRPGKPAPTHRLAVS